MTQALAAGASEEFVSRTEPFRRELLAHCYRMVGSVDDAEDLVQETYLRAWRSYDGFEGRSSVRTWLYRIATNACLSALQHRDRRLVPSGLGAPGADPHAPPEVGGPADNWLQPIPDALVAPTDPAEVVASRSGLRLALIVSLQHLPARQRAVLILRDVLAFPAAEVARMLDTSTAAVKSSLQRARARLDQLGGDGQDHISEPTDERARALLDQYIAAFETADPVALEKLLLDDAVLEMPPTRTWFSGRATCLPFLAAYGLRDPGDWRMVPLRANGQPAAAAYLRSAEGVYEAFGIGVLTVTTAGVARIILFGDLGLFPTFGCAPTLPADS